MANGLNINVSEKEFMKMNIKQQNWTLLQAHMKMDSQGCSFAKKHYRRLYPLVVAGGLVGGAVITLVKLVFG